MDEETNVLFAKLNKILKQIGDVTPFKCVMKKQCCRLSRKLRLLTPLFEDLEEMGNENEGISQEIVQALASLMEALLKAKDLLTFCAEASAIYMVVEKEQILTKFHGLAIDFMRALSEISYEKLDISVEVKEQVELFHSQSRRAAEGGVDNCDTDLYEELSYIYNVVVDPVVLHGFCAKLNLMGAGDVDKESVALHKMSVANNGDLGENGEKMFTLLKIIADLFQSENVESRAGGYNDEQCTFPSSKPIEVPEDFRCPISLDLMRDPVIIATGQTYDRAFIKKWLDSGHRMCPKTRQVLPNTTLIPNHALCSLISSWCETNKVEPPRRFGNLRRSKVGFDRLVEGVELDALLDKLTSSVVEDQRSAAGELRRLAKSSKDNRECIAEAGAIPLLAELLYTHDTLTQEHAVTALLNLSIGEGNKGSIIFAGVIPGILHVLKNGTMEARENAAATFFSLATVDDHKVTIGESGVIPALVTLLSEGSKRGKVDAGTALFSLCIYQGNRARAVRAGIVPLLITMLIEPGSELVDEALAIIAILAGHPEGRAAIAALNPVQKLVELVKSGSPSNKENSAAVLLGVFTGFPRYLSEALWCGIKDALQDLTENGTARGKRKATQLLELIDCFA